MNAWSDMKPMDWKRVDMAARHRDSIENKLIEFFERNPDEELAVSDVVVKYGATLDTVSKLMRVMAGKGLLEKRQQGRLHLYRRASKAQGVPA